MRTFVNMKKITPLLLTLALAATTTANASQKFYANVNAGLAMASIQSKVNTDVDAAIVALNAKTDTKAAGNVFKMKKSKTSIYLAGGFGMRMNEFGAELNLAYLGQTKLTTTDSKAATPVTGSSIVKETNMIPSLDFSYNLMAAPKMEIKLLAGLGLSFSKIKTSTSLKTDSTTVAAEILASELDIASASHAVKKGTAAVAATDTTAAVAATPDVIQESISKTVFTPKVGLGARYMINNSVSVGADVTYSFKVGKKENKFLTGGFFVAAAGATFHF